MLITYATAAGQGLKKLRTQILFNGILRQSIALDDILLLPLFPGHASLSMAWNRYGVSISPRKLPLPELQTQAGQMRTALEVPPIFNLMTVACRASCNPSYRVNSDPSNPREVSEDERDSNPQRPHTRGQGQPTTFGRPRNPTNGRRHAQYPREHQYDLS